MNQTLTTGFLAGPDERALDRVILAALEEDVAHGDLTSEAFIPLAATARAVVRARVPGVLSGGPVVQRVFALVDPRVQVTALVEDGEPFEPGDRLAAIEGPARSVLLGERIALNLMQRMSAIATATQELVEAVAGTRARVVDTRKTTPGLRNLERYAVRCGGGHNHRYSLSDAVMVKDNHLAVLTGGDPGKITQALLDGKSRLGHTVHLEVEVDGLEMIEPVLAAGVDTIMLDNFSLEDLAEGVRRVAGRAIVEASGNVRLDTIAAIAATGVDIISSGAITHSVANLDLGLDIDIHPQGTP
ncbi:carboxylating nicotinate-nucleotide diphosphorylase [Arthrobacter woluwensis]|uniref:carboxylating nicotinate-nucleotide diphosphorylase n=1 Tax=Arthrobacter woluwensis TaxID=156980 RepID=UPI001AAFFE7C|nr:carboxylating nicotinate-nucleotide diphosphorylase [Arthrobacter woluwensis]QTF71935.1 carboxylating nicotinate-nucleotide diphosphorylase [Arthrobacter woluwensis]